MVGRADREVGLLPMSVKEGRVLRSAIYAHLQAAAQALLDDINCVDLNAKNLWVAEDDIAAAAEEVAMLAQQLAILGRSVDDARDYRRGDMKLLTDDGHEDVTVQVPVGDLRAARDALVVACPDVAAAAKLSEWIERGEDQGDAS